MPQSAAQRVNITALLKGILNGYPIASIFREYLQNSDDAGAKIQRFIFDEEQYPTRFLLDQALKHTNGPALIAWNDGLLRDSDWYSLQHIHASNKLEDTNATGKNGLGFRSSFHVTDNPQILCGNHFLVFDPHEELPGLMSGGAKIDIAEEGTAYAHHLRSFNALFPHKDLATLKVTGTAFRLPLRTQDQAKKSKIKNEAVTVEDMRRMIRHFAEHEAAEAILFLKNIETIEITCPKDGYSARITMDRVDGRRVVGITPSGGGKKSMMEWKIYTHSRSTQEATKMLSERVGKDVGDFLVKEKLTADVDLAFCSLGGVSPLAHRLYTLLPLPIKTGFPVHINAVFALTPDRQSLKNLDEGGINDSRDKRFVKWNEMVFDTFVVKAWATLLSDLAGQEKCDIWSAWPTSSTGKSAGPQSYWASILSNVLEEVRTQKLKVFPVEGGGLRVGLDDPRLLVACKDAATSIPVAEMAKMGLIISLLPSDIYQLVSHLPSIDVLSPASAYAQLIALVKKDVPLLEHSASGLVDVLHYLVFGTNEATANFKHLVGLPIFRTADERTVSLDSAGVRSSFVLPRSQQEMQLFVEMPGMLAWSCFSDRIRNALLTDAGATTNALPLSGAAVVNFLSKFSNLGAGKEETGPLAGTAKWLAEFWGWAVDWKEGRSDLVKRLKSVSWYLIPTASNTIRQCPASVLLPTGASSDLIAAWGVLGISPLHGVISAHSFHDLTSRGISCDTESYVEFFAKNLASGQATRLTPEQADAISNSIYVVLFKRGSGFARNLPIVSRNNIAALPIFSVRLEGGASKKGPVVGNRLFVKIQSSTPLPVLPNTPIFVDASDNVTDRLVTLVQAGSVSFHDDLALLRLSVEHWDLQLDTNKDIFVQCILDNLSKFDATFQQILRRTPFVTVQGLKDRRPPGEVIDPFSPLAKLYEGESGFLPSGLYDTAPHARRMSDAGFFVSTFTPAALQERLDKMKTQFDSAKALLLLSILDNMQSLDDSLAAIIRSNRGVAWLPFDSTSAPVCPSDSRDGKVDDFSDPHLYDMVYKIIPLPVIANSVALRSALGWRQAISFEDAVIQIRKAVDQTGDEAWVPRLKRIIKYLAGMTLKDDQLETLRTKLKGLCWVPSSSRSGKKARCSVVPYVTLEETLLSAPFRLSDHEGDDSVVAFLQKMGCTARPTLATLVSEINNCDGPKLALPLLEELSAHHKTEGLNDLMIFDNSGQKRPREKVYFADVELGLMNTMDEVADMTPAHPSISSQLARGLYLRFLSALSWDDDEDVDDFQMGEDLVTRIHSVLRENDYRYAFNEWIANADDAKANTFSLFFDPPRASETDTPPNSAGHISAQFSGLDALSHFILYSDSQFTMKDFKAIRDIGRSSKINDEHSHGRYGLGALSFYYFADVVTIISNDQVLILDPSGSYLPPRRGGGKRTSSFKSKAQFFKRFPRHVQRVEQLKDLTSSSNKTIILLPLHCTAEGLRESGLSDISIPLANIYDLINHHFHSAARDALFFSRHLKKLDVYQNLHPQWVVNAKRQRERQTVKSLASIDTLRLEFGSQTQHWLVAVSKAIGIPKEHKEVSEGLKLDSQTTTVALAIRTDPDTEVPASPTSPQGQPGQVSKIFSTTLIPGNQTHLPFHLHSIFAVGSTRQSIVFHPPDPRGERDPKSVFNLWLVEKAVPAVYYSALEYGIQNSKRFRIFGTKPNKLWFPSPRSRQTPMDLCDTLAVAIVDHLPQSPCEVLRSADKKWISFSASIFPDRHSPTHVIRLLNQIQFPNLCVAYGSTRIPSLSAVTTLSPLKIADHLREAKPFTALSSLLFPTNPAERPAISDEDIQSLAYHIKGVGDLVGLPILLTTSKTLLRVPSLSEARVYVTPDTALLHPLFPGVNFLIGGYHPDVIKRLCEDTRTNVVAINEHQVAHLMSERLRSVRQLDASQERKWIMSMWTALSRLQSSPSLLHDAFQRPDLKIIDTTLGFISPVECQPAKILRYEASASADMVKCASHLGIPILIRHSNPILLDLITNRFPIASIPLNLIQYIHSTGIVISAETLPSEDDRHYIARTLRSCLESLTSTRESSIWSSNPVYKWSHTHLDTCKTTFASLSIWEAHVQGKVILVSANQLQCLPEGIEVSSVSPFAAKGTPLVAYSSEFARLLQYCRGLSTADDVCISAKELVSSIRLPTGSLASTEERKNYERLVRVILRRPNLQSLQTIMTLPDENLHLRPPSELFDHNEQTFINILRRAPESYFLHESFHHFGSSLYQLGIRQGLSISTFKFCVERIARMFDSAAGDGETIVKVKEMSDFALEAYITLLPVIFAVDSSLWAQLEDIPFIRRKVLRREGPDITGADYCGSLDEILPPSRLVRREYQAVAWSQRGLFSREPSESLLLANPTLGVPSVAEVVQHLQVLSLKVSKNIETRSLAFKRALLDDLKATYKFLDDNADTVKASLSTLTDLRFLNVDDPTSDRWQGSWYPAENLVFGLPASSESRGKRRVRSFLDKYKKLLEAAGAHTLDTTSHTKVTSESPSSSSTTDKWIKVFNEMRLKGEHTDVVLPASNVPEGVDAKQELRAHKSFLSASSTHFRDIFSSTAWGSGSSSEESYGTYFVIKAILDFLYTGTFEIVQDTESVAFLNSMLEVLHKADEWGLDQLKDYVQMRIIGDSADSMMTRFVHKLGAIDEAAKTARANLLKQAVETFEKRNSFLLVDGPEGPEGMESEGGQNEEEDDHYQCDDGDLHENETLTAVDEDDFDFDGVQTLTVDDF